MTNLAEFANTPATRARAEALKADLRARFGPSLPRYPAELQFYYGVDRELMVREMLSVTDPADQRKIDGWLTSLAEALSYQGRFQDAAGLTRNPDNAREYEEKAAALATLGQPCACPDVMVVPSKRDAKGDQSPARLKVETVFDGENRIAFVRCLICGGIEANIE
jgi:hypothetical protein